MLVDLKHRSNETELMDDPNISKEALHTALSDISRVNKMLGGKMITIKAINRIIKQKNTKKELVIIDVGCGDGEMLRSISDFFKNKGVAIKLIGIDINTQSINHAKTESAAYSNIQFINTNILDIEPSDIQADILLWTLTLHHFTDAEILKTLIKSVKIASSAVIINDLHRNTLAYYLYKLFSFFFIKGHVAKNDGLVSIKRGFKRKDLVHYAKQLNLKNYQISWKWAFRYRWIIHTRVM